MFPRTIPPIPFCNLGLGNILSSKFPTWLGLSLHIDIVPIHRVTQNLPKISCQDKHFSFSKVVKGHLQHNYSLGKWDLVNIVKLFSTAALMINIIFLLSGWTWVYFCPVRSRLGWIEHCLRQKAPMDLGETPWFVTGITHIYCSSIKILACKKILTSPGRESILRHGPWRQPSKVRSSTRFDIFG